LQIECLLIKCGLIGILLRGAVLVRVSPPRILLAVGSLSGVALRSAVVGGSRC
jgi:hypothetical protein